MLFLNIVVLVVLAVAALVALVVGVIYLHQGLQLLRFRLSNRTFAKDDAREDDPALEIPALKGTLEEERARLDELWKLFYRSGLSIAKLRASDRLRDQLSFTKPEWIEWEEWRGWQRLATKGSEAVRKRARDHARREADQRVARLAPGDLPLWLALYDDKEHPPLKLRWAKIHMEGDGKSAAVRVLEELATRDDDTGAFALYELFRHSCHYPTREKALGYAKRCLAHPLKVRHELIRRNLSDIFCPDLDKPVELGLHWGVSASRGAKLVVQVRALDVKGSDTVWLDNPQVPLEQAVVGDILWESSIPAKTWSIFAKPTHFFKLPPLEGPLLVEVTAQFSAPVLWSDCMGDEEMPIEMTQHRVPNTSLDAVLTLTENSVSTWVVDKKTKAPVGSVPVTLMRRDEYGTIETFTSQTDALGLFSWKGKAAWQFGVLIERKNSQGRMEHVFLTNGKDITTTKPPIPLHRFYVMLSRPLYRPGERVQGKLFARQKGHEGQSKRLPAKQTYQLEVFGPRGSKLTTISCTLSEFSSAAFELTLPTDSPLGQYSFKLAQSTASIEGSFHVEEFVAPEFRAELRTKDKPRWGWTCTLEFEANYFFGGPVANAAGTLDIKRTNWRYRHVEHGAFSKWFRTPKHIASLPFKTDARGRASIDVSWHGPWDLLCRFDGCDFDCVANVRDASGKSCQATLRLSVPRVSVVVSAKPVRTLRLPGETLPVALHWEPAGSTDDSTRKLTLTFRKGWTTKRFVYEVRRSDAECDMPLDLPPGSWEVSAHVEGQTRRMQTKHTFTLLGSELEQKRRELLVSNDPTDSQGTIRVAVMGPKTYCTKELLVWNRGPRLGSKVLDRSSPTMWVELPFLAGNEEQVHLALWYFDSREEGLFHQSTMAEINAPTMPTEAPVTLELVFPSTTVRPGADTTMEAKLSAAQEKPSELTVTVIDEAIFSLVPPPKNPIVFFEESPPHPESFAAWSVVSAQAQTGRQVLAHGSYDLPNEMIQHGVALGGPIYDVQSLSMAMPSAAPMMMMASRAPKSASPLRAAAMVAAAPIALVGAGAGLVAEAMSKKRESAEASGGRPEDVPASNAHSAPVLLRSDFSSEAAWIPNARFTRGASLTLPLTLPDTLTTWKATAVLVSLAHDHLLEAHAHVRTQKPLMIRLQAPRFFQERDELALRAMVDSRAEHVLSVDLSVEAHGFTLPENARASRMLEPNGQARFDVDITVPTFEGSDVVVRAQAIATNAEDASDAEERTIPYRPYGVLLRKTFSGVLDEEPTGASFDLPEKRKKEYTRLVVQIDRGPMDAIVHALSYLREYPYGCVEQTCSRLLPHLVWERFMLRDEEESSVYRSARPKMQEDVVQEALRGIDGMQNADGGFGWWPGNPSDLWMSAYVLFTFVMASRPQNDNWLRARSYLTQQLLKRNHSDDADVFAVFALAWTGATISERVLEVLTSRWDRLSLTEKAKLCWVLYAQGHERAQECADEVRNALVGPAKRFLKQVARDEENDLLWFQPESTEAIAFFVLALVREAQSENGPRKRLSFDDETLDVLVSFLLQHRKGQRWHNTRDTALAVFALITYEETLRVAGPERHVDVQINAATKRIAKLERLGAEPISMQFGDEDLRTGNNELSFVLDKVSSGGPVTFRHFTAELQVYTQEGEIAAQGEGIEVDRSYWVLNEKKEPQRQLRNGESIQIGERLRVVLKVKATKDRTYLLLEDPKLAGCEPIAKKSGREVCHGHTAHVELRADRTAIFFNAIGTDRHEVSYEIEAILPGRFTAMPARVETMYASRCFATSASFALSVV